MASVTPRNSYEGIYELLSKHNFLLTNQQSDDYKCVICQRILINAYGAFCGCNYCKKCVDEHVRSGVVFCIGDAEECKTANLSNVAINHRMNRQISQLSVKCPEEMCSYESQLRDMGAHLRLCATKSVDCPFIEFGCGQRRLKMDELNEHLQQESYRHSEILIGVIGNLRNELAEKHAINESINAEIEIIKLEKAALERRVDNLANLLNGKADKTALEQQVANLGNFLNRKADKTALEQQVHNLGTLLNGKVEDIVVRIDVKLEKMRREWRDAKEHQSLAVMNEEERNDEEYPLRKLAKKSDSGGKCLVKKIDADFVMTIDNICHNRQKQTTFYSARFNGPDLYKMQLYCHFRTDELRIRLCIYSNFCDEYREWPFKRHVTISIAGPDDTHSQKSSTRYCTIVQPLLDQYQWSDPFEFNWDELFHMVPDRNSLNVRCSIGSE